MKLLTKIDPSKIFVLLSTVLILLSIPFIFSLNRLNLVLNFSTIFLLLYYIYQEDFSQKSSSLIYTIYISLSFFGHAILALYTKNRLYDPLIFTFGYFLFSIHISISLGINKIFKNYPKTKYIHKSSNLKTRIVVFVFFSFFYFLSVLSFKLGITRMGTPHTALPFKLEPALNLFRTYFIPVFSCFLYNSSRKKPKEKTLVMITYLVWLVLEVYIRGSRGIIFIGFLPIFLLELPYFIKKKAYLKVILFSIISLIFFVLGHIIRSGNFNLSANDSVWLIYHRLFNEAQILQDFITNFKVEFFRNNITLFSAHDGLNEYYTHVIKKFPLNASHTEGITALSDGFAYFGVSGLIATAVIFSFFYNFNDYFFQKHKNDALRATFSWQIFLFTIWGDGFWDYFLSRNPMTYMVLPLSILFSFYLFRALETKQCT